MADRTSAALRGRVGPRRAPRRPAFAVEQCALTVTAVTLWLLVLPAEMTGVV